MAAGSFVGPGMSRSLSSDAGSAEESATGLPPVPTTVVPSVDRNASAEPKIPSDRFAGWKRCGVFLEVRFAWGPQGDAGGCDLWVAGGAKWPDGDQLTDIPITYLLLRQLMLIRKGEPQSLTMTYGLIVRIGAPIIST